MKNKTKKLVSFPTAPKRIKYIEKCVQSIISKNQKSLIKTLNKKQTNR